MNRLLMWIKEFFNPPPYVRPAEDQCDHVVCTPDGECLCGHYSIADMPGHHSGGCCQHSKEHHGRVV